MKKLLLTLMVLSISFLNTIMAVSEENPKEHNFQIDTKFIIPDVEVKPDTYVLDYKSADVNGDDIKDDVILIGTREAEINSIYIKNINIVVRDGKNMAYKKIMPGPVDAGYEPKIFLGDFNGDRVSDIYTSIASGGSGGTSIYSVVSFRGNDNVALFDQREFSQGLKFDIVFKNNFKIEVTSKDTGKKFILDVTDRKKDYVDWKVYDKGGKLLNPVSGSTNPISSLEPIDKDNDGCFELNSTQRLTGIANADSIGFAKGTWKYDKGKFVLKDLKINTKI